MADILGSYVKDHEGVTVVLLAVPMPADATVISLAEAIHEVAHELSNMPESLVLTTDENLCFSSTFSIKDPATRRIGLIPYVITGYGADEEGSDRWLEMFDKTNLEAYEAIKKGHEHG